MEYVIFLSIFAIIAQSIPVIILSVLQYFVCQRYSKYGWIIPILLLLYTLFSIFKVILIKSMITGDYSVIGIFSLIVPVISLIICCYMYYKYVYKSKA